MFQGGLQNVPYDAKCKKHLPLKKVVIILVFCLQPIQWYNQERIVLPVIIY